MTVRFHRSKGVASSIRRIATGEIRQALAAIDDREMPEADVIHLVRQQLKRLRALIRLPRGCFGAFRREDRAFRDLGRRLAGSRDADVLAQTLAAMIKAAHLTGSKALREQLLASNWRPPEPRDLRKLLQDEIAPGLFAALRRVKKWRFDQNGFASIGEGLAHVYAGMQREQTISAQQPSAANFHQWRKEVKYHANQLALLKPAAPDLVKGARKAADRLGELLGEHHDLDVLRAALLEIRSDDEQRAKLLGAIGERSAHLEVEAFRIGDELIAQSPRDFRRRVRSHWQAWHR